MVEEEKNSNQLQQKDSLRNREFPLNQEIG